jgi:hypothetical protein
MKKITKIKNLKKSKKIKDKFLTEIVFESKLEKILDERFKENNQVILSAVSEMMKGSESRMLAYTELRTGEILDILKDERQINIERNIENKTETENTNKFINTNILPRIEKLEEK